MVSEHKQHPPIEHDRKALLLVNLGTPKSTSWWHVRRYLSEFLRDRRVIEVNRWLWTMILELFVLTFRPARTARAYRKIWMQPQNESPLRYYSRRQADLLRPRVQDMVVTWAMRYGQPSIAQRLQQLQRQGCDRLLLLPLYPQYSATTTATACDAVFRVLMTMRWQPTLRVVEPYYDHPAYIEALAQGVEQFLALQDWSPDVILVSFHGLPQRYFELGDPYFCHCHKTTRLLRQRLGLSAERLQLAFQSRFGPTPWLRPYSDERLQQLAATGVRRVVVVMPGFFSDCIETLEEIALAGKALFLHHGGERFATVPCLNDSTGAIDLLQTLAEQGASGWRTRPPTGPAGLHDTRDRPSECPTDP